MYQLYAYGQKYSIKNGDKNPTLTLLYPSTEKFNEQKSIDEFVYDDTEHGLKIKTIPFDLSDKNSYSDQINKILATNGSMK